MVTVLYLFHCSSLLQNVTDIITEYGSYFVTKYDQSLSQNASDFLLPSATCITKRYNFITTCDGYYKVRSVHGYPDIFQKICKTN